MPYVNYNPKATKINLNLLAITPQRFHFFVFSFFMALTMSAAMSLSMTWLEYGSLATAVVHWPQSWLVSLLIAFPVSLVAHPIASAANQVIVKQY